MREHRLVTKFLGSILLLSAFTNSSAPAQPPGDWWPDPATHRGLSVWLPFSREYDAIYSDLDQNPDHDMLFRAQLADLDREGVEVVFLTFSSGTDQPHLQALSDPTNPVSRDVRSLLNRLNATGIRACAAIFSDNFTGSPAFLDRYLWVDHLVDFNANLDPSDAPFLCVTTDLEMREGSLRVSVYDLWKQFHLNMRNRIEERSSALRLLTWMQGPDFLISQLSADERELLRVREGIRPHPMETGLFIGAIRYFTTQDGRSIFDAIVPMWYFASRNPYARRLQHNFDELESIMGEKPFLIAGIMIRNDTGLCCRDRFGNPVCIWSRGEYDGRLDFNDTFRAPSSVFIGTGIFKWPTPEDWSCSGAKENEAFGRYR